MCESETKEKNWHSNVILLNFYYVIVQECWHQSQTWMRCQVTQRAALDVMKRLVVDLHAEFPVFPATVENSNEKKGLMLEQQTSCRTLCLPQWKTSGGQSNRAGGELDCRLLLGNLVGSLMDLTFVLSQFVVLFCFSFFFRLVFFISKKTLVPPPHPPTPIPAHLYGSAFYIYASEQEHIWGCHTAHKLKPKFGPFGTSSSIPSAGRGRSARQSVFIPAGSVLCRDIARPRQTVCGEHTPARSVLPRGSERHEAVRVYPGCPDSCAPSTLTSLFV